MFKKIRKGNKVLVKTITFRCAECNEGFDISDEIFDNGSTIPFSAKSSSGTLICKKCNSMEFVVFPKYQWQYRKRCPKCEEMFETPFSWESKCESCNHQYVEVMAQFGR